MATSRNSDNTIDLQEDPPSRNIQGKDELQPTGDEPTESGSFDPEAAAALYLDPDAMPLVLYQRLCSTGTPSTTAATTCATIGRVILNSTSIADEEPSAGAGTIIPFLQWQNKPVALLWTGYANGTVRLTDAITGAVIESTNSTTTWSCGKVPIVAVSVDATGTVWAALDQAGNCRIWTVTYRLAYRSENERTAAAQSSLTSFLSWGSSNRKPEGTSRNTAANSTNNNNNEDANPAPNNDSSSDRVPTLTIADIKSQVIVYSKRDYGIPTAFSLDPAYRKTNKLFVAFDSGKLVATAPNWMLFRSEHVLVPYPGAPITAPDWRGIDTITWRASLLALADCSGVQVYDTTAWKAVAHVDRPAGVGTGARASLCWERPDALLVAWGDCLLQLVVVESAATTATSGDGMVRRRTVSCSMAWSLDCIAAGVTPLDEHHVAILGYDDEEDDEEEEEEGAKVGNLPVIEFQIIDRRNGHITWADILPLEQQAATIPQPPSSSLLSSMTTYSTTATSTTPATKPSLMAPALWLVSSYATPRMDETLETFEYQRTLVDPYTEWDMANIEYEVQPPEEPNDDTGSIDSDCYDFLFQPSSQTEDPSHNEAIPTPPVLVFLSGVDVVAGHLRTVDDAIDYVLDKDLAARALQIALQKPSQVLHHNLHDLVRGYLTALLSPKRLSLRRMKMASDALPILLGADTAAWDQWVARLGEIPGALFVVRSVIPVRGMCWVLVVVVSV